MVLIRLPLILIGVLSVAGTEEVSKDLFRQLRDAPALKTESLGVPVKSIRAGMLLRVPNPDGKSWDLIQIYFPRYGGPNVIVIMDTGSGEVKQLLTDKGWNFHLCPTVVAPNGKLFISILNSRLRQKICIYDPATNELKIDAVKMPDDLMGETHPLVLGTDNMLYAIGQHPTRAAAAAQINPDTLKVTFYGAIGPSHAPNSCWGYYGAADDRFVYIASGKIPWYLVAYDRKTGKSSTLLETSSVGGTVRVIQRTDGVMATATRLLDTNGAKQQFWAYNGKVTRFDTDNKPPPWPERGQKSLALPEPDFGMALAVPDTNGFAEVWYRDMTLKQKYKNAPPGTPPDKQGWNRIRFQVPLFPHSIYRLTELPDGRIFGTAGSYEGNFVYDPKTGGSEHLGKILLSHYSTTLHDGKIYMSGYPTSPLFVYDPSRPWTAAKFIDNTFIREDSPEANPRLVMKMGGLQNSGTHKMYAAVTGADDHVYFGGRWMRNGACGGLAWYEPSSGKIAGMWREFSNYQITHLATVHSGRTIVISTRCVDDSALKKPKPDQGALFVFDTTTKKIVRQISPFSGISGTGVILGFSDSKLVGLTSTADGKNSLLYTLDVDTGKRIYEKALAIPLPYRLGSNQKEAWDFRRGPDGKIWTFLNSALVRIEPEDGRIEILGRPTRSGPICFAGDDVYLGGSADLRRVSGLVRK